MENDKALEQKLLGELVGFYVKNMESKVKFEPTYLELSEIHEEQVITHGKKVRKFVHINSFLNNLFDKFVEYKTDQRKRVRS